MTLEELRARYVDIIPFTAVEMKDNLLTYAFKQAVNYYNKFDPVIRNEVLSISYSPYTFTGTVPDFVLRVHYYNMLVPNSDPGNVVYDWYWEKPYLYVYSGMYDIKTGYGHTLANVNLDDYPLLDKLAMCEIMIALSNKRRMATLNNLPFELKGDQFYSDALTERDRLKEEIGNIVPVHF